MLERAIKGLEEPNIDSKALAIIMSMLSALLEKPISLSNDAALASIQKVDVWGAIQCFRKESIILSRVGQPSKEILSYFWEAIEIGKKIGLTIGNVFQAYLGIAAHFLGRGQYDAARDLLMQASDASREHFPVVAQVQVLESLMASSQFELDFAEELLSKSRALVLQRRMGRRLLSDIEAAEQTIEKTRGSLESLEKLSPLIEGEFGNLEQVSLDETLRYIETLQDRYLSRQR